MPKCFDELVKILIERDMHISAAESCTGGLFTSHIVDVPDASKVLCASFVTYSENAKERFVEVSPDTIRIYGVVSKETAVEMAKGAAQKSRAEVGIGITGFAGPSGGDAFAMRGTVYVGCWINGEVYTYRLDKPELSRNDLREYAAIYTAEKLTELLR